MLEPDKVNLANAGVSIDEPSTAPHGSACLPHGWDVSGDHTPDSHPVAGSHQSPAGRSLRSYPCGRARRRTRPRAGHHRPSPDHHGPAPRDTRFLSCRAPGPGLALWSRLLPGRRMQSMLPRGHEQLCRPLQVFRQPVNNRPKVEGGHADPVGQGAAMDIDAGPGDNLALSV